MERRTWMLVGGFGALLAAWEVAQGQVGTALLTVALLGVVAWWMSPWRTLGGATQHEVDQVPEEERGVVVYWRPGCPFCERLRHRLGAAGRAQVTWVDIWRDPEAAAYVRGVTAATRPYPPWWPAASPAPTRPRRPSGGCCAAEDSTRPASGAGRRCFRDRRAPRPHRLHAQVAAAGEQ